MDYFISLLTLFVVFLFTCIIYWYYKIPKNLPPGPRGLPFVGSLPFLSKSVYLTLIDFGKKYGNIFHIYMGSTLAIVLNDFESIKEAFVKQAEVFSGRMDDPHFKKHSTSLVFNDGEYWRQHRRFLLSNLRSNGIGKHAIEPRIMNEINYFINELQKTCGQPTHILNLLSCSLFNNVLLLTNNLRYNYDDPRLTDSVENMARYVELSKAVAVETFFPWVGKVPGSEIITKLKERTSANNSFIKYVKKIIAIDDNEDNEGTYVKAFMTERNKRLQQTENETIFTEEGLLHNTRDLLAAGGDTSSAILCWALLYLTKYSQVQLKAHEEIDRSIGRDREATYNDRFLTPYVEAIIMEVQRIVTLVPLSMPHRNIRQTTLFGYTIPAGSMIIPNVYAVHHDKKVWGDPENFRPERFISDDGELIKPEYLIPFSLGKRACAGEPLARMELYLYLVTFLQTFKLVPTKTYQSLESNDAIMRHPANDLICYERR